MIKKNLTAALIVLSALPCWSKNKTSDNSNARYKVICEKPEDCPSNVAGVLSDKENVCTGVLVKEDVLATNLHCLPQKLRKEGASCKGHLSFSFPENKNEPEEFAECDQVLSISSELKDTPLTPDYAFLKLRSKVSRKPATISTQGIVNNETMTIYKVDPHEDIGVLRKVTCKAAQGSMLNPLFLKAQSSVISLVPCDIVSGNSGSPIFSADNEVKAIINSKGLPDDMPVNADRFDVAFASNFSCLNIPELKLQSTEPHCKTSMDRAAIRNASGTLVREAVHPLMSNFSKYVAEQFQKVHAQTKNFLKWEANQLDIPYSGDEKSAIAKVTFKPKCISATREDLEKMQSLLNINYSEWGVELHLDQAGRPLPQLASREVHSVLSFLKQDPASKTIAIQINDNQYSVPFCGDIASRK